MKSEKFLGIAFILILIPILSACLLSTITFGHFNLYYDKPLNLSNDWSISSSADISFKSVDLPYLVKIPAGTESRLTRKLPNLEMSEPALFIKTVQQYVKVFINDKLIYEYAPRLNWFSHSPGSTVHFVDLPADYKNTTAEIVLDSPFNSFSGIYNEVYIGCRSSLFLSLIEQDIFSFVISLTILVLGTMLLIVYISLYFSGTRNSSILYLSFFSILSGLWMASERKLLLLFINDPVFILNIALLSLFCLPIPILLFIKKTYQPRKGKVLVYLSWIFLAFIPVSTLLQIFNIIDYILILPVFHIICLATIIMIVRIGLLEIRSGNKGIRVFFHGCFIFSAFIIFDIAHYYMVFLPKMSSSSFFQIGMLLFIIIIASSIGQSFFYLRDIQIRNRMLLSLAYTDGLTRLKNRTSFDEMIRALNSNLDSEKSIHLIILDINDLKTINDTLGHKEGDHLLFEGAKILRDTIGKLGEVYRIGGDEFAMIIRSTEEDVINNAISELFEQIDRFNENTSLFKISIAYGMASIDEALDSDLHSVFVRADKAMYNCKINQKHIKVIG